MRRPRRGSKGKRKGVNDVVSIDEGSTALAVTPCYERSARRTSRSQLFNRGRVPEPSRSNTASEQPPAAQLPAGRGARWPQESWPVCCRQPHAADRPVEPGRRKPAPDNGKGKQCRTLGWASRRVQPAAQVGSCSLRAMCECEFVHRMEDVFDVDTRPVRVCPSAGARDPTAELVRIACRPRSSSATPRRDSHLRYTAGPSVAGTPLAIHKVTDRVTRGLDSLRFES
jgi:hypothetical protein